MTEMNRKEKDDNNFKKPFPVKSFSFKNKITSKQRRNVIEANDDLTKQVNKILKQQVIRPLITPIQELDEEFIVDLIAKNPNEERIDINSLKKYISTFAENIEGLVSGRKRSYEQINFLSGINEREVYNKLEKSMMKKCVKYKTKLHQHLSQARIAPTLHRSRIISASSFRNYSGGKNFINGFYFMFLRTPQQHLLQHVNFRLILIIFNKK